MNYIQTKVPAPKNQADSEILIAKLMSVGFDSFEEQQDSLIAYIPENEFLKEKLLEIDYYSESENLGVLVIEVLPDKNWNEVWESNYPPVTIDNRCYVRAPFHEGNPEKDYEIVIHPKMAFGTAHHETTAMMIQLILRNDHRNNRVLDMGCGTGVLAILASMKGAKEVMAVDIDPWSSKNALENVKLNNINNVRVVKGGVEITIEEYNFDIILANINKNILLRDMKYYADALLERGHFYFSGFYSSDLSDIEVKAGCYGLELIESLENNNWAAAVFVKLKS